MFCASADFTIAHFWLSKRRTTGILPASRPKPEEEGAHAAVRAYWCCKGQVGADAHLEGQATDPVQEEEEEAGPAGEARGRLWDEGGGVEGSGAF